MQWLIAAARTGSGGPASRNRSTGCGGGVCWGSINRASRWARDDLGPLFLLLFHCGRSGSTVMGGCHLASTTRIYHSCTYVGEVVEPFLGGLDVCGFRIVASLMPFKFCGHSMCLSSADHLRYTGLVTEVGVFPGPTSAVFCLFSAFFF